MVISCQAGSPQEHCPDHQLAAVFSIGELQMAEFVTSDVNELGKGEVSKCSHLISDTSFEIRCWRVSVIMVRMNLPKSNFVLTLLDINIRDTIPVAQ